MVFGTYPVIFKRSFLGRTWLYKNLVQKCFFFRQMENSEILNGLEEPLVMPLLDWEINLDLQKIP